MLTDTSIDPEARISGLKMMARDREPEAFDTLQSILESTKENEQVRMGAAHAVCLLDKRDAYPLVLKALSGDDVEIRNEVISNIYMLHDSRLLFPLVNLFNQLDDKKVHDWHAESDIVRAIGYTADPRAVNFLQNLDDHPQLQQAARAAYESCRVNHDFMYTFHGKESKRLKATKGEHFKGHVLRGKQTLRNPTVDEFLRDEMQDGFGMASYVVQPNDPEKPFDLHNVSMTIALRRSEHLVTSAKGEDVLAAGEIGFDLESGEIGYLSNQSAGYMPGVSSIAWIRGALGRTDIQPREFTNVWPAHDYCSPDFLIIHPLYRESSQS